MLWIVKMPYLRQRGAREMRLCKYRNDHIKQHVGSWSTTPSCLFGSSFPLLQLSASFHIPVSWGNGCFQQKSAGWDISVHPPCSPLPQLILFPSSPPLFLLPSPDAREVELTSCTWCLPHDPLLSVGKGWGMKCGKLRCQTKKSCPKVLCWSHWTATDFQRPWEDQVCKWFAFPLLTLLLWSCRPPPASKVVSSVSGYNFKIIPGPHQNIS